MSIFLQKDEVNYHLDNIQSKLDNKEFDGPLDLLLTLINRDEIDIKDIFVSEITKQYLTLVSAMDHKDSDYEAEFIEMATRLLRIKSAALLPRLEDTYAEDETNLIVDLEQYKEYQTNLFNLMQEGAEKLRDKEILYRFYREPKFTEKDYRVVINDFNLDAMIAAFSDILERVEQVNEQAKVRTVAKERVTVEDRVNELVDLLREKIEVRFFSLFENDANKEEIVNTFLAVLMLLKRQIASGMQKTVYGDIIIRLNDTEENENEKDFTNAKEYD